MGTRGYTEAIINGKVLVRQYGQWDHYPTYAGAYLVDWLKDPENIKFLRDLDKIVSPVGDLDDTESIQFQQSLLENHSGTWGDIMNYLEEQRGKLFSEDKRWDDPAVMKALVADTVDKFGFDHASTFLLADRDVGFRILQLIRILHEMRPDVVLKTTVPEPNLPAKPEGMIRAVNTIFWDTSDQTIRLRLCWGQDGVMTRTLKHLPSDEELEEFENNY